jgi:peptidoglycan/LPS O-acetylase OafA/YrhL
MTGSILLIYSVSSGPLLQRFFQNSFSRYLGRISFSLYLVHGPICHMIGHATIPQLWALTGGPTQALPIPGNLESEDPSRPFEGGTNLGYESGVVLGALVVVPCTIWIADVFCRFVDEQFVKFAREFENFLAMS